LNPWTYLDSPLLSDPEQQEPSHPEVVSHIDTLTWTDLELPLRRHHLGVDTRDVDTGVEACSLDVSMRLVGIRTLKMERMSLER
jgi:hypothetical protein